MSWANRTGESRRILAEAKGHKFLHRLSMGQRFRQSPEKPKWGLKKLRKFTHDGSSTNGNCKGNA